MLAVAVGVIVCLGSGAVLAGVSEDVLRRNGSERLDANRLSWIAHHRVGAIVWLSKLFSDVGAVGVVVALAVLASALLWWRGVPLIAAAAPSIAVASAGAVAGLLKVLVGRARPPAAYRLLSETDASFPSGHATGSMALGLSVAVVVSVYLLRRPLARAAAMATGVIIPTAIGLSRLELGVHWPTDVVAGLALGTAAASIAVCACVAAASSGGGVRAPDAASSRRLRVVALLRARRGGATLRMA